jgi:hypothetical protein
LRADISASNSATEIEATTEAFQRAKKHLFSALTGSPRIASKDAALLT